MKFIISLLALFLVNSLLFAQTTIVSKTNGVLEFIELDHGLVEGGGGTVEKSKNSPTGQHRWLENFEIVKVTDSIPAEIKSHFGVVYMIKAKDTVDINVVIEWIYPKMVINEKGEKYRSVKYTTVRPTNIPSASAYYIDAPYELVKGDWKLNIYLEGKLMYSKTFLLY